MQHSQQSPLDEHRSICEISRVELDIDEAVIPEVGNMIYMRDSASDSHAGESLDVPLIRPGVVAIHKGGFFDKAPPLAPRHVDPPVPIICETTSLMRLV